METKSQKTDGSNNRLHPFLIGLGCGGAVLVMVIIAVTLLQFFLQITLGGSAMNTPGFWSEGIIIAFIWGSLIGIPLAVVVGLLSCSISWFIKRQQKGNK